MGKKKKKAEHQTPGDFFDCYVLTKEEAQHIEDAYANASPKLAMVGIVGSAVVSVICAIIPILITGINPIVTIMAMILLVGVIMFVLYKLNKKYTKELKGIVTETALQKARYTGICMITESQLKRKDIRIVTERDENEYIVYVDLKNCMKGEGVDHALIIKELSKKMNIDEDCIEKIIHLSQKCSTKFARNRYYAIEQTRYEFYHIHFKPDYKKEITEKIEKSDQYQWELLSKLRSNDEKRNQNRDVLMTITELLNAEDTSEEVHSNSFPEDAQIKIIWNIADTNKCGQGCAICATQSSRKCMNADQKSTVLTKVLAYGNHVAEIDFSGGDPLLLKEDRDIIQNAIRVLGNDKVFVTTTQNGIKQAQSQKENLRQYLHNTEITLDLGKLEDEKRKAYNIRNKKLFNNMINLLKDNASNIYVNVPIVNPDVSNGEIKEVVNSIKMLKEKVKRVNLMRLMKVGKCNIDLPDTKEKAIEYRTKLANVINTFEKTAGDSFPIHYHCALRGLKDDRFRCDMRDKKIGIDCAGNVYTCAWGAYIDQGERYQEDDNLFYMGNALKDNLEDIINASRTSGNIKPMDVRTTCACCIYSYLANGDPHSETDFLFASDRNDGIADETMNVQAG